MALLDLLATKADLSFGGETPVSFGGSFPESTTHVDGQNRLPGQSELDLDGATPAKYSDNPPA
jgi:hypothetical protein|tara:strand:+ start:892 stop:1080 length:189 start_codon:yes stop_codon:yes gene_type:complete